MKKLLVLCLAALLLTGGMAAAQSVTVGGFGTTEAEAENDALRNAVEKAVGTLVDAKTLVDKNVVLQDEIYTASRGFITNYRVIDKRQNGEIWLVTIDAVVDDQPDSKLMNDLTRLGIIDKKLRNPKIVVYIPEYMDNREIPESAVETGIVKTLVQAGFTNATAGAPAAMSTGWNSKAAQYGMTDEDIRRAARFFSADILIMGEATGEGLGDVGQWLPKGGTTGLHSGEARMDAKLYIASTGQIIAADGKTTTAADVSDAGAVRKAMDALGKEMGTYFLEALLENGSGTRQSMELTVKGSETAVSRVEQALSGISGVKNVQLRNFSAGQGLLYFQYSGSPQTLFRELKAVMGDCISLEAAGYNTLIISAAG